MSRLASVNIVTGWMVISLGLVGLVLHDVGCKSYSPDHEYDIYSHVLGITVSLLKTSRKEIV